MTTITRFGLVQICVLSFALQGCTAEPQQPELPGRATYKIPLEYEPEPGPVNLLNKTRRIDAPEFSFMLTEDALAEGVEGFQAQLNGVRQDTMVIVSVYDPVKHGDWQPSPERIQRGKDIWTMTGSMMTACMHPEVEPLTGYYRYYTYCDPGPDDDRSNFWLMDRVPDPAQPPPSDRSYIKGVCREQEALVRPEDGSYTKCRFGRRTEWQDRYTFNVKGENLRYLEEIEDYIAQLLLEWKEAD